MIIDRLANVQGGFYPNLLVGQGKGTGLAGRLAAGFAFLQQTDLENTPVGRVEIDGDRVFALVQEYQSKPTAQGFWESHRKYLDIQYVVSGVEQMGYANLSQLQLGEYDADKDVLIHEGSGSFVLLPAGMFAIMMPDDGHMPGIAVGTPHPVKKVVVKVAVED